MDQISSANLESLLTMLCLANVAGGSIIPAFKFLRVHFKEYLFEYGPFDDLALVNVSGCIIKSSF